ncbi:beta-galactosidase [Anaeromicropila herbilytica]|uniref:Beta-galactosidase n=1 Tax=Anaeromicropila herbilytica TaxID=2785025 RepID=A0A7R7EKI9_9FIRM|nr:beta-galactosidase [Anaeromicropila herbilytica]BCN30566.1 beta-galactosidase [Anaeromicropila herbilytica]
MDNTTTKFDFNNRYLTKDDKPWFPIMGEMHYSRYPKEYWKESLYKMKAGGVMVVSSYVIWIHHEEIEGEYDFVGNKDLRKFVETCKECGLHFILRFGPWSHAEVRNGGFPDWLLQKEFEPRTNDPRYFAEVEKYFKKIYEQVEGLFLKDGGPIIGIQIENEYGHCGGLDGEEGEKHMIHLKEMAQEIGYDVPIYTATGWGGAVTGGCIPVMGGYCEAPWDQRLTEIEPSGNYIFTHERNDHNIGSDHGIGEGITFDASEFPYLTAELGGGLQVTHHRRPIATSTDIGAMSMVKLGSGVNLLGYYMYHGGTNPKGKLSTLQESRATGYLNDLPELSYDFRAPIREYGQMSETLKEIKLLSYFVKEFGEELCEMDATIPESNPLFPTNFKDLRTSIRKKDNKGYIFVNNYQRKYKMADHENIELKVELDEETITYPTISVRDSDYFFLPFNMKLNNAVLKSALATPLCKINDNAFVFYTDKTPSYDIVGDLSDTKLLTITKEEAKNAWKVTLDKEYLIISNCAAVQTDQGVELIGREKATLKVYPEFTNAPDGYRKVRTEEEFTIYEGVECNEVAEIKVTQLERTNDKQVYELNIEIPNEVEDCFIRLNYGGDSAKLFVNDEVIADNFYTSRTWEIGLKGYSFPTKLRLEIYPLYENAEVYLEKWPQMKDGKAMELFEANVEIEYKSIIKK